MLLVDLPSYAARKRRMVVIGLSAAGLVIVGAMVQRAIFGGGEKRTDQAYLAPAVSMRNTLPSGYGAPRKVDVPPPPPPPPEPPLKLAELHPTGKAPSAEGSPARKKYNQQIEFKLVDGKTGGDPNTLYTYRAPSNVGRAVRAGTSIQVLLETGINSDLPGSIAATVLADVRDSETGRNILVPRGTKVIGKYVDEVEFGQRRVGVAWHRLVFPDGASATLGDKGMLGTDKAGFAGATGEVDAHWGNVILSTIITTMLGAASSATATSGNTDDGYGDDVARSGSREAQRTIGRVIDKTLNVAPTITVQPGSEVSIFVERDLVLRPWRRG